MLNSNDSPRCPHNMVNISPLGAEICWRVWGTPAKFQRVSRLASVTAATSLTGGQPNFARCLAVTWAGGLYIHFRLPLPRNGILPCWFGHYISCDQQQLLEFGQYQLIQVFLLVFVSPQPSRKHSSQSVLLSQLLLEVHIFATGSILIS